MKKAETKISSVRQINDPALSIVKVKRHPVSPKAKSTANKVNFNFPSGSNTTTVFNLPVAIPEEGLKELYSPPQIKTKPVYFKPSKKNKATKNKKKTSDGGESMADGTSEYIYKLTSDIQAIEDKLSKVEGVLSKKSDNVPTLTKSQVNTVSFKTDITKDQKVYNASDYVDDGNMVTGYPPFRDRNSYSLELHNKIIKPLYKGSEPFPQQYPIDFDPKAAVSAIRSELEQWRKDNRQTYPTLTSVSNLRNEASSCDLVPSISEENTVSRDVAEKDIPSSSEDSRSKFQEHIDQGKQIMEHRATDFPLDHYLEFEKTKKKHKVMLEQEREEDENEPLTVSRTEKLIKQINALASEAEEKVKSCIYNRPVRPSPVLSSVSMDESDSGYTEHLVEAKFNEVTFQIPKGTEGKSQQEIRKDQLGQLRKSYINKSIQNPNKYGRETYRSTAETMSSFAMPHKQTNRKKFNTKLDSSKHNRYPSKPSPISNSENRHLREDFSKEIYPNITCHYCSCDKDTGVGNHLKHLKKNKCRHKGNNIFIDDNNSEQTDITYQGKQYNDVSVNTDPLLLRHNTNLINVVSSKEEKCSKMKDNSKKLCQIQELPLVVIRPNFTKQVGPIIDIKTTMPSSPKNNVAIVECFHGGSAIGAKESTSINIIRESSIESTSQTASPPAVHFKNSRDLKLLKVTKDLLGKLNFKDGANVERLKKSLTSLVTLLNQISPIHVANLRISNLEAGSASESIDTFFSNIDLVTEIIENEIKKPTGRYCDYPECLIKAVDLLCGNIRSVFVIEDIRKRTSKPVMASGSGDEKKNVKKYLSVPNVRKQSSKPTVVSQKASSVPSSIGARETEGNMAANNTENIPGNLYIPYRLLIPGGKHKLMEEAKNSQDIELRFKRLEKVLEINENLKKAVPSKDSSQTNHSIIDEDKPVSNKDAHALNETFIIKSASEDDEENEIIQEKSETKINKADQEYEDDWEEVESSKSYDGSLAMTDINIVAQVHSSEGKSSLAHSSPKKQFRQEISVSSKGSQTGASDSFSSRSHLKEKETKKEKDKNRKAHYELKDVKTQYFIGKRDISTMYNEDITQSEKPKVDIIEPINIPPETGCFTVLRMTNASTNSLLEVRFPEQTEKLQSSLTVQKTHNSEEVKLLYNLDKEDNIISRHGRNENGLKSFPAQKDETIEPIPNHIEKVLTRSEQNINDKSSSQEKKEINDFQNITTNFIQFLESKVTEMVNKFKTSEVTCEKLLDQKLTLDHKTSANNIHISSSKTSLKNEFFYKSASSLISAQSNEELGNWLSRQYTPDNQEIPPFENLTSPTVGLQLKDSSALIEASDAKNVPKPNLEKIEDNLFEIPFKLGIEKRDSDDILDKFKGNLSDKVTESMKLVLKEKEINKTPSGLHNRLLPLPEDVNYNRSNSSNDERLSFIPAIQFKVTAEIHHREENKQKNNTIEPPAEMFSFKPNETTGQEADISERKSALFEEAISALASVEQIFENTDSNEESTVIVAKTPTIISKSGDELDSQGTSISHFANILSASENEISPKFQDKIVIPVLKDLNSTEAKLSQQEQKSINSAESIPIEKDFSRLFPIPKQIKKDQPDIKLSDIEPQVVSNSNVHSLFVTGPSHVDRGLKSSDYLFRKTRNSPILAQENESPISGSIENLAFDNPSHSSNPTKSDSINDCDSVRHLPKSLPLSEDNIIAGRKQINSFSQTSPPKEVITQTLPLSDREDASEISDDYIKLNYFNPEEMSDGEIGYMYTSNSYSSGEIKPYDGQNKDEILSEPSTVREVAHYFELATNLECGEPNLLNSENRAIVNRSITESDKLGMEGMHTKSEKTQKIISAGDLLNSSNDSTSTGELKKLFNKEEKIDEERLIDIHVLCSARFSSESSGGADSVESRESIEDI